MSSIHFCGYFMQRRDTTFSFSFEGLRLLFQWCFRDQSELVRWIIRTPRKEQINNIGLNNLMYVLLHVLYYWPQRLHLRKAWNMMILCCIWPLWIYKWKKIGRFQQKYPWCSENSFYWTACRAVLKLFIVPPVPPSPTRTIWDFPPWTTGLT